MTNGLCQTESAKTTKAKNIAEEGFYGRLDTAGDLPYIRPGRARLSWSSSGDDGAGVLAPDGGRKDLC